MELEKRLESLDDRYNCLRLPHTPRAARSARRRCLFKRKGDGEKMCAFDLLATVAGRLLSDRESSQLQSVVEQSPLVVAPIVKKEKDEGGNKPRDQDCLERNFIITELVSEVPGQNSCSNELACAQNDPGSAISASGFSEKVGPAEKLIDDDCNLRLGISNPVDGESSGFRLSANSGSEDNSRETANNTRNLSIGYRENQDGKPSELVCSVVNNVKFPFPRDQAPCGSFLVSRENVKLVSSRDDDDENSFEYTEPSSTRNKAINPLPPRPGDRRFRRFVPSNNAASSNYPTNQNCAKWQRSPRDYPFKKRKLYECGSGSTSDEGGAPEKVISGDERLGSSPGGGYGSFDSFHSQNTPVKLKIKSFKVPELYIEIPETSTVGSLKKTVMESVNSVLGGGLRVGVLLQGKKIRDDNKTLAQTGISHNSKMDSLGFTLEPNSSLPAPPIRLYPEARLGQSPQSRRSSADDIFIRYPPTARSGGRQRHLDPSGLDLPGPSFNNDSDPSESKALVPLSSTKFKRSESAQRRIRRPFTVAEVEALVQAVEKLGTGRWRDVKLRAFDSAKHRTYVDLKDKWKTLVHTARISPQQRRGEPVPQELLDRVLTAHAYWSQQQSKQQLKSQPDTCLLL